MQAMSDVKFMLKNMKPSIYFEWVDIEIRLILVNCYPDKN